MRILHIIDSGGLYGAEMMLLALMEEQKKMGLIPTLASIGLKNEPDKDIEQEAERRSLNVKKFRLRKGPDFFGGYTILEFAKKNHFSLLHSHGYKGNILLGFWPKRIRKIPMVATLHGWTSVKSDYKMRFYEWLDRRSLQRIDLVVLVNQAIQKNNHLKLKKFTSINNGLLPPQFNSAEIPTDDPVLNFCKDGFILGSLGRLSREKNYKSLLESIGLLREKGYPVKLLIIGEGPDRSSLEETLVTLGLGDNVILAGYRDKAHNYIKLMNIFVISSLTEGMPISLLEAMAAEVPVISTAVGGIPEVLDQGRAGLLVPVNNSEVLAEKLEELILNQEKREALASRAKLLVSREFSSKRMAEGYLRVYRSISNKLN
jgi:glycosyltransferase involved in cell wall biosynthesis